MLKFVHLSAFAHPGYLLQSTIYDYLTGMKLFLFIVLIAAAVACGSRQQSKERTIYNKEFSWTITIPAGFDSMTKEELETSGAEPGDMGGTLFGFKRKESTLFFAKWVPFDLTEEDSYEDAIAVLNKMIYKGLKAQVPGARLDSFSAMENISGMKFPVFGVKAIRARTMTEYMFYRKPFGKKELVIYIGSSDMADQLDILTAWRNSKFGELRDQ